MYIQVNMVRLMCAWIVYLGISTTLIESTTYPSCEPKHHYPLVRNKQYDFPTYIPVAFLSSSAVPVRLPPLRIDVRARGILRVQNKGRVVFNPDRGVVATLTGGPVFKDRYIFTLMRYGSEGVPNNTRNADTHDGVGYTAQFMMTFYKDIYTSLEDALKARDGLVKILFPLIVEGNADNPLFAPVEKVIYEVRQFNATSFIRAKEAFYWLFKIFDNCKRYYAYPGAYVKVTGQYFFCSNDIHPDFHTYSWISHRQFNMFEKVMNEFGQRPSSKSPVHPLGPRPFVEAVQSPVDVEYY